MFPNPDDAPATQSKQSPDFPVPGFVSSNLRDPKTLARFWHPAMPPAAMPKAAVYENSQTLFAKHEIGPTR